MEPSPADIQTCIVIAMKRAPPQTQTRSEMAQKLKWLVDDPHRVAMNMDVLAKSGRLELDRKGWDGRADTKRYRLPPGMPD
jgi:hypothetical protein